EPGFMTPEMVGHRRRLVGGKHAGRHGIGAMLKEMGFTVNKAQLKEITARQKALGDKGKEVTDADLRVIAEAVIGEVSKEEKIVDLEEYTVTTGNIITPSANVRIKFEGVEIKADDTGVGPVDAALNAVRKAVSGIEDVRLREFRLDAITGGSDALADVIVKLGDSKGNTSSARAAREDIVNASVEAMISGINKILLMRKNQNNRKS
ncbi:MAG: alpha-isopropylmalate synthase regulatory domain-containing protein, partial [Candidatus Hydrothermarchaeales archaeon]